MMTWLRNKLRAFLRIEAPSLTPASAEDEKPMSIANVILVRAGEKIVVQRKVTAPKLPENVRGGFVYNASDDPGGLGEPMVAYDDATNAPAWAFLNQVNCGLGFPGYGYLAELSQRSEYRAPTETIASEATREWIDITVNGKASAKKRKERGEVVEDADLDNGLEDKIEKIEAALKEFKVRDHFRRLSEVDGFFGRAQLFINVESNRVDSDQARQLPLIVDKECIRKGALKGLKVIEPIWTSPYNYNSIDPTRADFYKPRAWFVMGKRTHASRLLTFISREVPDILKPAYNFGGISLSQLMEPFVFQWIRTRNSVSDLIHNFSIMVLKTDMAAVLQGDAGAGQGLMDRAKLFTQTRDNQGLTVLDMTREDLTQVAVPLGSLDKLQAQAQEHMSAPSHIPLVKLTGITPAGLNANSEGEIQVWYDWIRAYQIFFFGPHLPHLLNIIQLHLFGEIDEAISYEFRALSSPTVKELAEIRKANADTDATYIDKGVISPEEARERVAADPESGYNNLSGPAPQPPNQLDAEHNTELEEGRAQADHDRNLESQAQAAKLKEQQGGNGAES